ncbi:MAG: molybdopterin biosynthesis protein, partial [Eggerthellaceae bacterium]|nr:molybdopterin biosynthesis protein [Eggerthellaceae bacterium]
LGRNFESNSVLVKGKGEQWGGHYIPFDIVPDDPDLIKQALDEASAVSDIIVLNAGSSKGSDDWCVEILEQYGQILYHQTKHGPGHHSSFAMYNGVPVVGISGPSGGASFTLNFYLLPLMRQYLGQDPVPEKLPARLAAPFPAHGHRPPNAGKPAGEMRPMEKHDSDTPFVGVTPLRIEVGSDGQLEAYPIKGHMGSGATNAANAYCLLARDEGHPIPEVGDTIMFEWRSPDAINSGMLPLEDGDE